VRRPRVCLIVDNPLRDLDGLVLLAWQLAHRGVEAWLVPMYEQSFDVRAIGADLVLVNYVRSNNIDHLMAYRREGIRVGVLDTEGVGGKTPDEFAALVASSGGAAAVDLYCVWGAAQREALLKIGAVPEDRIQVTGCPRYDYCAPPWKNALPLPDEPPGYVLINTNFPIINPRFSSGAADEADNAVKAGFSRQFAEAYVHDARAAQAGLLSLMEKILEHWPNQRFILRPHPFEAHDCYQQLKRYTNFSLRQEGTSVEWLNQARALLHLNCSTAVEAAMLGKPALSPGWLDTPVLHVPGPSSVSQIAASPKELVENLNAVLGSSSASVDDRKPSQRLEALYHHIDGRAAERVANAVLLALKTPFNSSIGPRPRLKSRVLNASRKWLGYRTATYITNARRPLVQLGLRASKLFTLNQVQSLVERLDLCAQSNEAVRVSLMNHCAMPQRRLASQQSIRLTNSTSGD
jgi:surface carbohydrate biosynthesis protein